MGNLCGGEASQQTAADRQITRELHEAHRQLAEEVKLLLLGKINFYRWLTIKNWILNCQ
jgi:hypothetical protein